MELNNAGRADMASGKVKQAVTRTGRESYTLGKRSEALTIEGMMADSKRDEISDGQIEEAEEEAADPSHEKIPPNVEDDERGNTEVNK
jgi:hypothetical protein